MNEWMSIHDRNLLLQMNWQYLSWSGSLGRAIRCDVIRLIKRRRPSYAPVLCVRRLWLVPRTQAHRQQPINLTDFIPDSKHDSIQSLVEKINKKIEHKQLKGSLFVNHRESIKSLANLNYDRAL